MAYRCCSTINPTKSSFDKRISNANGPKIATKLCKKNYKNSTKKLISSARIRSFTSILDSCVGNHPKFPDRQIYFPFRPDQPIEYEPIQWQPEPPTRVLQPRNEPNTILLDDNDDQNFVDEENEEPKKKIKKKKPAAVENPDETTTQLNTSANRPQKLSSKWSNGKRISGFGAGKTSAIRKFARPSNDRQHNRPDSRTLFRTKPSVTASSSRLSQEQREQMARAVEERKQEERKRKVEKLHEQAKKREEVLNRAKQIQQDKEQKNQLRVSDNQAKKGKLNTSSNLNNSMNDSTNLPKTTTTTAQQPAYKPVVLDTTSNKILGQTKGFKQPANLGLKKPAAPAANAEYTFVVDKNNTQRNDITLPSSSLAQPSAQHKADWTILPTPGNVHDELELDSTMT